MFYDGKLKNGVTHVNRPIPRGFKFKWPKNTNPLAFVATPGNTREQGGRSKKNDKEGEIVKRLVGDFLKADDLREEQIGVVTPYSAQVSLCHYAFSDHRYS